MPLIRGPLPSFPSTASTKVADGVVGSSEEANPVPTGPTSELKTAGDIIFIVRCLWSMPVLNAFTTRIYERKIPSKMLNAIRRRV